ncbi:MAG: V-type ATPase subunit [Nitrospinae bacterium]|nr:V-type ATPase subunit [Nitrospinota bacterium]
MDFGYINARIRAWKGDLFKTPDYNKFLSAGSVEDFIKMLKETCYGLNLEEAKARFKEEGEMKVLEKGLKANLFRTLKEIWDDIPPDDRILIKAIISFWDVYNLKTIIRGIHKGISPDEIYSILILAGDFDESALKELTQPRDIRIVIHILDTWGSPYAKPLRDSLRDYLQKKEIIGMELALDRFVCGFYLNLIDRADMNTVMVSELIKYRIDAVNIITLFRFVKGQSSYPLMDYYIHGGKRVMKDDFMELGICRDEKALLRGLTERMKGREWREMLEMADAGEPSMIEESMEDLIGINFCRKAVVYPLSIAVAICFCFKKIREIKNLMLIGRGKEYSIPENEIRRYLRI